MDDTILLETKWIAGVTTPSESSLRSDYNFLVLLAACRIRRNPLTRGIKRAYDELPYRGPSMQIR